MPPSTASPPLSPEELAQAVAKLTKYLEQSPARFSISGGAATMLICMHNGLRTLRSTNDIDLVVQPAGRITAESISTWLLENYPTAFVENKMYGVSIPALAFLRFDGSVKNIEIEMFDVQAWPQRPQYNLDDPDNDVTMINVAGVQVPVFSASWLLREKIVTAFERQGSQKEETDLQDAANLLKVVGPNSVNLTNKEDAVRHMLAKTPALRQSMELKIICPAVLGQPWTWNKHAAVYWRFENNELRYLDKDHRRHECKWDPSARVWYFIAGGQSWFYSAESGDLMIRT